MMETPHAQSRLEEGIVNLGAEKKLAEQMPEENWQKTANLQ